LVKVEFHPFDKPVSHGDNLRKLPLSMRKTNQPGADIREAHERYAITGSGSMGP
jgi:hypothetical protein